MLVLKLTPAEVKELLQFLTYHTQWNYQLPLINQIPSVVVLEDYLASWTPLRRLSWSQRRTDKAYRLSLKPVVALALHQEMQYVEVSPLQQGILNQLNQAITNFRNPHAGPHVIGVLNRPYEWYE